MPAVLGKINYPKIKSQPKRSKQFKTDLAERTKQEGEKDKQKQSRNSQKEEDRRSPYGNTYKTETSFKSIVDHSRPQLQKRRRNAEKGRD